MIIPADAVVPYANDNDRFSDRQRLRPVDGSSKLPADLPEQLRQHVEHTVEHDKLAEGNPLREAQYATQERRQNDRRQKTMPVTLDTRLTRSRRKSGQPSPVSIKI